MNLNITKHFLSLIFCIGVSSLTVGCSSPEEKAQEYYDTGMELLDSDPIKAKLEFQNALQIKKNMVKAIYGLALASEKQADWKSTFGLLNKVVAEEPQHLEANVKIGQMFLAAGNLEQAEEFLKKGKAIDAGAISVKLLDAAYDLKTNAYASAVAKANQILSFDPKNQQALMILATERYQKDDFDQAIQFLDQAIDANKSNIAFQLFKVKALKKKDDYAGVVALYKSLINEYPEKLFAREALAQYYFEKEKFPQTEEQLQKLIGLKPNDLSAKLNLVKFLGATKGQKAAQTELEKMAKENPEDYDLGFYLVDFYDRVNAKKESNQLLDEIIATAGNKPEGLKAMVTKAYRLSRINKRDQANVLIEQVLNEDSGFPKALMLKSSMQLDDGDFDGATLTLRTLLRDQPNSVEGLFLMAKVQELMGSAALADESYVQAMYASKDSPKIGVAFAKSLVSRKQNARAEKVLKDVLKRHPRDENTAKYLAQLSILDGDLKGAQDVAEKLKGYSNSNLSNMIEGAVSLSKGEKADAIAAFKRAHAKEPEDIQAVLAVVNTYFSQKQYNSAERYLNSVIGENLGNQYQLTLLLAQLHSRAGQSDKVIQDYRKAIELEPKRVQAYQGLATAYAKQGVKGKAKEVINKGLSISPNSFDLKMLSAELLLIDKDYSNALKAYRLLRDQYPQSLVALNNYISVAADYENDPEEIQLAYDSAKRLTESNAPQFLDSLGWISYRNGKHDEAVNHLTQVVKKAPYYAVFQYHLGKAYIATGDNTKAKKHLEKALQLAENQKFSHTDDIKELLKSI